MIEISFLLLHEQRGTSLSFITNGCPYIFFLLFSRNLFWEPLPSLSPSPLRGHLQFITLLFLHTQAIIIQDWQSARTDKKMLKKLLPKTKSKKKKEAASSAIPTLDRLHETLEMLEKKERFLQKKVFCWNRKG
jgi:hypothetical protein